MGVISRQGLKDSIVSYVGVLIGMVSVLIIYPATLSKEELGIAKFLTETAVMLNPFLILGSADLALRYYPHFRQHEKNGFLLFLLLIPSAGFVLFLLFLLLFGRGIWESYAAMNPLFERYLVFLVPLTGLTTLNALLTAYCYNAQRIVVPSILNNLLVKLSTVVLCLLYAGGYLSFDAYIWLTVASFGLVFCGLLGYLGMLKMLDLRPDFRLFNKPLLREMAGFAGYNVLGLVSSMLLVRIDIFMVGTMTTLEKTGVYSIASFVTNVVDIPKRALEKIVLPTIVEAWRQNDLEALGKLYRQTSLNQYIAGGFMFLGIWCSIDDLFALMPKGDQYIEGKWVVLWLGIGRLIDMATGVNGQILIYSRYYRINFYVMLATGIANTALNIPLIQTFGIEGAAIGTMLALLFSNLTKFLFLWHHYRMQPFTRGTLQVSGLLAIGWLLCWALPDTGMPLLNIVLRSGILGVLLLLCLQYWRISPELSAVSDGLLDKLKKRIGR
jgi:O-antigen/teichoic acid export membrane protein